MKSMKKTYLHSGLRRTICSIFMENTPILEGYSTESAHEAKGGSTIAVGDKVEISYRGHLMMKNIQLKL